MEGPSQQPVVWGNQFPTVVPGTYNNLTRSDGKLWGGNVRRIMGILQIIGGGIGFVLNIAVMVVPAYYFDHIDYVGWGIWTGVFAIVTGSLGALSVRKKSMVTAYMTTSIITAVLSAGCFMYAVSGCVLGTYSYYYGANLALYLILCILFLAQMVISIIGASFTCGAVCVKTNQPQQMVYYTTQPLPQQYAPTPLYSASAPQSGLTSQTTTPSASIGFVQQKI